MSTINSFNISTDSINVTIAEFQGDRKIVITKTIAIFNKIVIQMNRNCSKIWKVDVFSHTVLKVIVHICCFYHSLSSKQETSEMSAAMI